MQGAQNGKEPEEEEELEGLEGVNEGLIRKHQLPLSAQSAFSYIPPRHKDPPELSYFYQENKTGIVALYDCVFKRPVGYDAKLHRCDREHANSRGLHINDEVIVEFQDDENHYFAHAFLLTHDNGQVLAAANYCVLQACNGEKKRPIAVLSSSEYGRHINKPVEELIRDYVRINHVKAEFYRKNGIACLIDK